VVSFHAHPDDEVLLTGGTLARAAAAGHRVVLVVATDGEAGLAEGARTPELGRTRAHELERSAEALGVARLVRLRKPDSGWSPQGEALRHRGEPAPFAGQGVEQLAGELAGLLHEEAADLLTTYDAAGGYGHPDHRQVHRVGARAAVLAGTPVVLEATLDRDSLRRALRLLRLVSPMVDLPDLPDPDHTFTASDEITHVIDVRHQLKAKKRAMTAHASQATGPARTLALLRHLPPGVDRLVLGREWFREVGREPGRRRLDNIFATLLERTRAQ
jgi:LmbE family N-acetylglucosaminyl deacetylase